MKTSWRAPPSDHTVAPIASNKDRTFLTGEEQSLLTLPVTRRLLDMLISLFNKRSYFLFSQEETNDSLIPCHQGKTRLGTSGKGFPREKTKRF